MNEGQSKQAPKVNRWRPVLIALTVGVGAGIVAIPVVTVMALFASMELNSFIPGKGRDMDRIVLGAVSDAMSATDKVNNAAFIECANAQDGTLDEYQDMKYQILTFEQGAFPFGWFHARLKKFLPIKFEQWKTAVDEPGINAKLEEMASSDSIAAVKLSAVADPRLDCAEFTVAYIDIDT